ncbi:glycoside hydrolase family 3 N-terminal domain-containing protein [Gloeocapsopsis dulcis]|uniref:beta-N-acetylhexosaminidase n=1 Tax=Gloeocapsopsis dulcis AAB1 = 1H9 TaxID=1433147 RepID=A0A6N8FWE3_9CHRO|nr:glycoside hydrolase family 3 N-terminal domain-containing protein [Gloeocapsopsis dulcis]MUL36467.1 beta-glucosidase [Gloeocapsopsis dulcis AAB1 = 1H9]WNN87756.1 glycoside hydrolase family 3 N-terminal domain-containing protein [Gloeocapsopsis dulcis]
MQSLPDINSLSLAEQVAQMIVVRASGYLFDHQIQYPQWEPPAAKLQYWLEKLGVGGVILLGGSAGEIALRSQQLQNWAKFPLLIAADIEEGVGQRFAGATEFPPPMALGAIAQRDLDTAIQYASQMGAVTAQEALAIGINWVLAPVVDVNNNPANPVINVRAFGETPEIVSQLTTAFIQGAKKYPVLTAAKHFPGHGDTATDSHLELPVVPHAPERLAEIELPPFRAAIAAGVDAVMSAHLLIPAWDSEYPATLSQKILTQQLRNNLSFDGLIVTDALVMGAIANRYGTEEAAVLAVEAGVDILLMPLDPEAAIQAVCTAIESDRISLDRIRTSVERIWQAKQQVEYAMSTLQELAQPAAWGTVNNILQETQIISGSVPISGDATSRALRNLVVVDNLLNCDFLSEISPAIAVPKQLGYTTELIDCHTSVTAFESQATLLQLFIRGTPFRGSAGLTQLAQDLFKRLFQSGNLQALIVYGSPYVVQEFLPTLPTTTPYLFSYGQMAAAQLKIMNSLFDL